jgi:phosphatidylserine/phosphatidylglycerophosphate/cardiolipin synthase-like enzyme
MSLGILQPGRNCWRTARADRAAALVDASAYYEAFARAAEKAERSILITAWDIDSRVRLRRDRPTETLLSLFLRLLDEKPNLEIHVLNWKFVLIYADDREVLPWFDSRWRQHPRLHFQWDAHHPKMACHHQKIVVIDDRLAFSGGLDFTDERWDTPDHLPVDRRRKPLHRNVYKPFHDTMMMMEGPVAAVLGDLVRDRWMKAVGPEHKGNGVPHPVPQAPHLPPASAWPENVKADLTNVDIGVSRTEPGFDGQVQVREVEQLFEDSIAAAREFIYIENQYFTATRIVAALARRLREPNGPEVVVVLPEGCTGWIETFVLGVSRQRIIRRLRNADRFGRLHIYYPHIRGLLPGHYIKVHAKFMIVDDDFLRIGSANLCNRSMFIDTECDVALESGGNPARREAIRQVRMRLLAEHTGTPANLLDQWQQETGSIAAAIATCSNLLRRLVPFSGEVSPVLDTILPKRVALDSRRRLFMKYASVKGRQL